MRRIKPMILVFAAGTLLLAGGFALPFHLHDTLDEPVQHAYEPQSPGETERTLVEPEDTATQKTQDTDAKPAEPFEAEPSATIATASTDNSLPSRSDDAYEETEAQMEPEEESVSGTDDELVLVAERVSGLDREQANQALEEHREDIAPDDLDRAFALLERVDAAYLYDLARDGLDDEERVLFCSHLEAELTQEEVETVMVLFNRYAELLP